MKLTNSGGELGAGGNHKTWRFPRCAFVVECSPTVLEQIRQEVERGFRSPRGERETGGVLFGRYEQDCVRILAQRPLPCEHAIGPGFVLSAKDEERLAALILAPHSDARLNSLEALGWYHSHIQSKIFLSERDCRIHSTYFDAPFQIALVLRPAHDRPMRAGFFFKESSGEMRADSCYAEFTVESASPRDALRAESSATRAASAETDASRRLRPTCPKCGGKHIRRSHRQNALEQLMGYFDLYPYRCGECLSRFLRKSPSGLLEHRRGRSEKRPAERRRTRLRTRDQMLLWGGGVVGFLFFMFYSMR